MNAHSIDRYRLVRKLKAAGFSEAQAAAVMDALRQAREFDLAELATKAEIHGLQAEIRALEAATTAGTGAPGTGAPGTSAPDSGALQAMPGMDIQADDGAGKADTATPEAAISAAVPEPPGDIRRLEAILDKRITDLQRVMMHWAVGLLLAQLAGVAVLLKLLH